LCFVSTDAIRSIAALTISQEHCMAIDESNLIWIDLEMTVIAIHQPESVLAAMDEWNTEHHTRSGLVKRVRESSDTLATAQQKTLKFLAGYCDAGVSPMCGNSICQDRRFMVS